MDTGTKENYELLRAIEENDLTNVIKFLGVGCSPNPIGEYDKSPLITAIGRLLIDFSVFKQLLEYGADPNMEDWHGNTPLKEALKERNKPVVKLFLEFKANPNKSSKDEPSAFEEVVRRGDIEFIKLLIEHGADINFQNPNGQTPLEVAFMMENTPVVNILKYYGAIIPSLKLDESHIDNPAFDRLMTYLESIENKLEDTNTRISVLEEQNKMLQSEISKYKNPTPYSSEDNLKNPVSASNFSDRDNYEMAEERKELDNSSVDSDDSKAGNNGDWDYLKKDKSCKMCAGTGFMGGVDGEDETCPYCCGAGIE